jgi:tryptophanyl-tRNA synthetase
MRLARDLAARVRYFGVTEAYASFELDAAERAVVADAHERLLALWHERHGSGEGEGGEDSEAADDGEPDPEPDVRCIDAARLIADGPDAVAFEERTVPETVTAAGADADAERRAVAKLENAGREPLRPRVRVLDRNATDEAFDALVEAVEGEKRVYDAHVDAFDLSRAEAEALAREVEVDHGGYGFHAPSSLYHRFMTGLTGGKMSSSVPASHISLLDDPEDGYDKVKAATTGGRETAEKQRELGGEADDCPVYELYAYLLAADDDEYAKRVYDECVGGERLCGGCKEEAAELMREFLAEHQEKRAEVETMLEDVDVELDVAGTR